MQTWRFSKVFSPQIFVQINCNFSYILTSSMYGLHYDKEVKIIFTNTQAHMLNACNS